MAKKKTKEVDPTEARDAVAAEIGARFGKNSVMDLDQETNPEDTASSGLKKLNDIIGGGVPRGRIIEIFGPEASGKTIITLKIAAAAQKRGELVAFVDAENTLDPKFAKKVAGFDVKKALMLSPDHGEHGLEMVRALIRGEFRPKRKKGQKGKKGKKPSQPIPKVSLVIVDSVATLVPKRELDGEVGDAQMGSMGRMMSQALRQMIGDYHQTKSETTVIFINQLRSKVGLVFGNPETTSGGNALKFYSSLRLDTRRQKAVIKNKKLIGFPIRVKVVKNKLAAPFKECFLFVDFEKGIRSMKKKVEEKLDAEA